MTVYIEFSVYRGQYNREKAQNVVLSYERESDCRLPVSNDKTNKNGWVRTTWHDDWIGRTIYVYCDGKFVTSVKIRRSENISMNIDYPDSDPRRRGWW